MDPIDLPVWALRLNLQPWYWFALVLVAILLFVNFRLRDSRLGRAWIALREDEIAAVAMGVPSVKTKLQAYATGAAFGGIAGAFLGSFLNTVNADQFQFSFSILVLGMIILGGLGSIWGVVLGAIVLSFINNWFIPDVLNDVPGKLGSTSTPRRSRSAIYGLLLVMMMILRPQGLLPERRHKMELAEHAETRRRDPLHGTGMSATEHTQPPSPLGQHGDPRRGQTSPKHFGGLTAGQRRLVQSPEQSIVSIIGPNGAGKTTFFNMLTGLLPADARARSPSTAGHHGRPAGHRHEGGDGADVPEHPPVLHHDRGGERDGRRALAHARGAVRLDLAHAAGAARGAGGAREGARRARVRRASRRAGTTSWRSTSPTATSGGWRSPARWRRTRRCCCSTSRRRA